MKKKLEDGQLVVIIGVLIYGIAFTLFGFIIEQPCNGIDVDSLYCALHPMSFADYLGCILLYAGFVFISGVWAIKKGGILLPVGSTSANFIGFAGMVLGVLLCFA